MTAELLALAAEIEALKGPSREMDARIEGAIGPESEYPGSHLLGGFSRGRADYLRTVAPAYTGSIDAAMALVSGHEYFMDGRGKRQKFCVHSLNKMACGSAPTMPLAICAAGARAFAWP